MALLGATFTLTSKDQYLAELAEIADIDRDASLDHVDYSMRSFIAFAASFYEDFLLDSSGLHQAVTVLLRSSLWQLHSQRHCLSLVGLILQKEQSSSTVSFALQTLSAYGQDHHFAHKLMRKSYGPAKEEPDKYRSTSVVAFMMQSIQSHGREDHDGELMTARLPWLCTEVLYEACRHTRLTPEDLSLFSEDFVFRLFELVELTRDERDDTFNYTLVKLIIALNEQFMVASLQKPSSSRHPNGSSSKSHRRKPSATQNSDEEANVVLRTIRDYMGSHKTFGENLIFILNRCGETDEDRCVALLILKILYLLFTSPGTNEYFYTNDLCVLVDVFIRELHDLAEDSEGLRHTFLRVLHPLLTNTQLRIVPYKRSELRKQLREMITESSRSQINATTKRLVERNLKAPWSQELEAIDMVQTPLSPTISVSSAVASSPDALESSLPDLRESTPKFCGHHASKSEGAASRMEEATIAIENIKLSRHQDIIADEELSRRSSTMSTNSLASQNSVAAASLSPDGLQSVRPWESEEHLSHIGLSLARPASAGSDHSLKVKKRKPPPIPYFRRAQPKELNMAPMPSLSSLAQSQPASSPPSSVPAAETKCGVGSSFRRRVHSEDENTTKPSKRAPPPVPKSKPKPHQHASVETLI